MYNKCSLSCSPDTKILTIAAFSQSGAAMSLPEQQAISWKVLSRMTGNSLTTVSIGNSDVRIVEEVTGEYEEDGEVEHSCELMAITNINNLRLQHFQEHVELKFQTHDALEI